MQIFNIKNSTTAVGTALFIARVGIAVLMLTHGIPKLEKLLSGEPVKFASVMGMTAEVSLGLAVFAEVFCSVLVLVGFATRLAVIPLIITMLVAILSIHAAGPLGDKEPALHYLLVYVVLLILGSGKFSVDSLLQRKKTTY